MFLKYIKQQLPSSAYLPWSLEHEYITRSIDISY